MTRRALPLLALVLQVAVANTAQAQSLDALHDQAVEAFGQLDLDAARRLLDQGLSQQPADGGATARLHALYGVLWLSGYSDADRARAHFQRALALDPEVRPDPQLATPDVTRVFEGVRSGELRPEGAQPERSALWSLCPWVSAWDWCMPARACAETGLRPPV